MLACALIRTTACPIIVQIPALKYSKKLRLTDNSSIFSAELVAILEALRFLIIKPPMSCVIFSDSLSALQSLEAYDDMTPVHHEIRYCLYQLYSLGIPITICWIPSHVGVPGNEKVDRLAKEALSHMEVDFPLKPSIHDLNKFLEELILNEWQTKWESDTKGRSYYKIQPKTSFKVKYSDIHKEKQTAITRLRLGKCRLNDVLFLLHQRDNDLCDFCYIKENVSHFLLDCIDFQHLQQPIIDKFLHEGRLVSVEALLGEDKWYDDIWNYVKLSGKNI